MATRRTGQGFPLSLEPYVYDVFLSFRGSDTRNSFINHLYMALREAGINVFLDDELMKGEEIAVQLLKAVEMSRISIVVFSKGYANSSWCLDELAMIMECRRRDGQLVLPIFYHVDPSDVRNQRGSFAEAFSKHQERFRDNLAKVRRWTQALTEAANLTGWNLTFDRSELEVIVSIKKTITRKLDVEQLVNPELDVPLVGIKSRVETLFHHVDDGLDDVRMVGIFGARGIGKTTVAKAMYDGCYNDFDGACFLDNVRKTLNQPNGLVILQEQLLTDILKTKIKVGNIESAWVRQIFSKRRILLIIDDIDEKKQLDQLAINRDCFGSGSRIVVITREEGLLKQVEVDAIYSPEALNEEEAIELFSWHAFKKRSPDAEYSELSRNAVALCGGLPATLKSVGCFLSGKSIMQWENEWKRYMAKEEAKILKEIILYCSLFPPGYEFRKDELVQLWIAEDLIKERKRERMEDTGISYFNSLENESFFVHSRYDFREDFDWVSSLSCNPNNLYKMNDNVDVSGNTIYRAHYSRAMDAVSVPENIESPAASFRAVDGVSASQDTVSGDDNDFKVVDAVSFSENTVSEAGNDLSSAVDVVSISEKTISQANDLRAMEIFSENCTICLGTLLLRIGSGSSIKYVPRDLFWSLNFLRTLKLSGAHISELPSSIRNVKELRLLDVSYTPITRLPESIDSLHNLQTLKLKGCVHFDQLPDNLKKLTKLRHIELDIMRQLDSLPANLGNLTDLQTLSAYLVGKHDGCHIGELKNLNDLTGALCISRLENVSSVKEAGEAYLVRKKYLHRLELRWSYLMSRNKADQEDILESLEPHCGLKELHIKYYGGSTLPTWISNPSFAVLVAVTLYRCKNCILLPSLGQLPALKVLSIMEMNEVKEINHQFFRNGVVNDQAFHAFPKLERLEVDIMLNLKEWKEVQNGDLPSLLKLTVVSCPELVTLPSLSTLSSLKHLEFRRCPKLLPSDRLPDSLESLMIVDCPQIKKCFLEGYGEEWRKKDRIIWLDDEEIKVVAQG